MKSSELYEMMSSIDERYIESARRRGERAKNMRKYLSVGASVAACAVVFVGCLFAVNKFGMADPNATEPVQIAPPPDAGGESGFVIENGVLVAYNGVETELTIPDEVTEITAAAFSDSPKASAITAIHLNSAVSKIDENAFGNLASLKTLTVADDNASFVSSDGVIGAVDGSVYFAAADIWRDENSFLNKIMEMEENIEEYKDVGFISAGNVIIELCRDNYDLGTFNDMGNGNDEYITVNFSVVSVQAYGHKKTFDTPESLGREHIKIRAYQTDEAFVFELMTGFQVGEMAYIFTEQGIFEVSLPPQQDPPASYLESIYIFNKRDDGKLGYTRSPAKFALKLYVGSELQLCVSRDEFCKEVGYVSFEDGEMIYVPERAYTVSEVYDLEKMYADWGPLDMTLDEYLEFNSQRYERAEMPSWVYDQDD